MPNEPKRKDRNRCACCGRVLPLDPTRYAFDADLQGNVGRCCAEHLLVAVNQLMRFKIAPCVHEPKRFNQ